uniref:Uncharacterized protein n=1 Tax=Brassica campestris TaxID=3711 RepID=A0A3P6DCV2_BRACM|nr:unnamed protein product [Brassica rapa]
MARAMGGAPAERTEPGHSTKGGHTEQVREIGPAPLYKKQGPLREGKSSYSSLPRQEKLLTDPPRAGHTSSVRLSRGRNRTTGKDPADLPRARGRALFKREWGANRKASVFVLGLVRAPLDLFRMGGSPFEVKAFAFLIRPTNHERLSLPQLGESPRNDIVSLMSYGNSWLETILMVLISGRNNKNQSPGSLNAELLTLLVRMGVHPKVFPDCMHTSVLGLRSVHMSSLRCLHRNQNLFSILSRVRIAPPNFLVGRAVVELRQVLRVTLLLVFLAGMPIVPCDNYSWRKGWATRWAGQSLLLEEIDLTCYRTESSAGTGFSKAESFFALINEFISFFALLLCLREAANIDAREGGEGEEWIGKSLKGTKFFLPSSLCIV